MRSLISNILIAAILLLIVLGVAGYMKPQYVSGGEVQAQEAPFSDLSGYSMYAATDSSFLCNRIGCAALPDGTIILIPLPRQVKRDVTY